MKIKPPVASSGTAPPKHGIRRAALIVVAVFTGWQLAGLPGALILRYEAPYDMPWYGFGVKQVAVDADGTWHIARQGYADRAAYYVIPPGAELEKHRTAPVQLAEQDVSGNMSLQPVSFADGRLSIKASRQYWVWRWRLKNLAHTDRQRREAYRADGSADLVGPFLPAEPNVVLVFSNPGRNEFRVLAGYQHYRVFDGAAALAPNVWVTTDRGRWIHRLLFRDLERQPYVELVASKPTRLENNLEHSTSMGVLEQAGLVYMLLPGGRVDYFDALSLDYVRSEQLPGDWRAEYGQLRRPGMAYNFYQGVPLAEDGYFRIMRSLMLVFLLSLLGLTVSWSTACISISDRTTGDIPPSSS